MRVVVGSDGSKNLKQAELERHLEAMSRFIEAHAEDPAPACTLVLRSAASAPAQALTLMKDVLCDAGIRAQAILAKLEPQDDLQQLFAALSDLSPDANATTLIRWARNPRLREAHEQVTYGAEMCWSGDAMRRDADTRNPLVLFETDAPEAALRARRRFVPGRTVVRTKESESAPAGFDTGDVAVAEAPRNFGDLSFEVDPVSPRPGEPYSIKLFISNTGRRKLKTQSVSLVQKVDGETKPEVWAPELELGPGERALLKEVTGSWPEGVDAWRLQVTVQTATGDKLECRLSWR